MNLKLMASSFVALIISGAVSAAEPMSADAVKRLLTNNTTNCRNLEKNREFINYYRDDGAVVKLTSVGEKQLGKWRVADNGQHCVDWGGEEGECCFPVIDLGNGTYQKMEGDRPKSEFTVTEGNPENL
jgi:hypothetical protein